MPQNTDDIYVCFGVDVAVEQKRHIIAMVVNVDNPVIVHHMLLFQTDSSFSTTPVPCHGEMPPSARMIFGWAPGVQPFLLPPEAGFPEEGTAHFFVQMHYNNIRHLSGQADSTSVDFCTTDQLRPNDANVLGFGTESFTIPARSKLDLTCNFTIPQGTPSFHTFAALPHMHQLGTLIDTVDIPGGTATPVDMGGRPYWDFNTQSWSPIAVDLKGGDVVRTRCAWSNTTDSAVSYGPYTENEMCFSFTMYYPAKQNVPNAWQGPAQGSKCAPTQ